MSNPSVAATIDPFANPSERRPLISRWWVLTGVLLALATVVAWLVFRPKAPPSTQSPFLTAPVRRADIVSQVTATGTLSPVVLVEVGSQVTGRIAELFADFNSKVTAGQVIARLDPRLYETAVSQAPAQAQETTALRELPITGATPDRWSAAGRRGSRRGSAPQHPR
jgi:HlyD family secretion protein